MSGRVSALVSTWRPRPVVGALLLGGFLSDVLEGDQAGESARILFLRRAAISARRRSMAS